MKYIFIHDFGTPAQIRTEKTLPFERSDFTKICPQGQKYHDFGTP